MNLKVRCWLLSLALVGTLILTACGGGGGGGPAGGGGGPAANLNLGSDGEQLKFSPATLTAKAGSQVTVTFKNNSASQQHNWVLVKGGDDVAKKVDDEGATAGVSKGYIPDDAANIVSNVKLLNGGESGTTTFPAPPPGTYTFLCTFPGHFAAGMKGTFTAN